jgi:hypothetical protein
LRRYILISYYREKRGEIQGGLGVDVRAGKEEVGSMRYE